MVYFSDLISVARAKGFEPVKQGKKNIVMIFQCPECGKPKMGKFILKADNRAFVKACTCGYREYTDKARRVLNAGAA